MIKKMAWNAFKKTGDIDTFLEFKQIETIENNIKEVQNITNLNLQEDDFGDGSQKFINNK